MNVSALLTHSLYLLDYADSTLCISFEFETYGSIVRDMTEGRPILKPGDSYKNAFVITHKGTNSMRSTSDLGGTKAPCGRLGRVNIHVSSVSVYYLLCRHDHRYV